MNQGIIRKPLLLDIESIIRIWLESNIQAHPFIHSDYWLNNIGYMREVLPESEVYVYEQNGSIVGFIGLENHHIAGLFVDRKYQSQGIGTRLIEFIKKKYFSLTLNVYKKNDKALLFYQKQNFITAKEMIDTNNNEVELLMIWNRTNHI